MIIARRLSLLIGLALLVAAVVLMLLPLHANGVSGNALQPHYTQFGVAAGGALLLLVGAAIPRRRHSES